MKALVEETKYDELYKFDQVRFFILLKCSKTSKRVVSAVFQMNSFVSIILI